MNLTRKELKQKNLDFQSFQEDWHKTKSKEAWDKMFMSVAFASETAIKKLLKTVYRDDYKDLALDAAIIIMNRYVKDENYKIDHLPTVARWAAISVLYNDKQKAIDKEISYDYLLEIGANIDGSDL